MGAVSRLLRMAIGHQLADSFLFDHSVVFFLLVAGDMQVGLVLF